MSKKNSLEQKKLRRQERELHSKLMNEQFAMIEERVKEIYKQAYKLDFKLGTQDIKQRVTILLKDRIGEKKAKEFIEQVEKEPKGIVEENADKVNNTEVKEEIKEEVKVVEEISTEETKEVEKPKRTRKKKVVVEEVVKVGE